MMGQKNSRKGAAARLAERIVLRHRENGYLRFDLPDELAAPSAAAGLEEALARIGGVYRVRIDRTNRKLSIRFFTEDCGERAVVLGLAGALENLDLDRSPPPREAGGGREGLAGRMGLNRAAQWVRERYERLRLQTGMIMGLVRARKNLPAALPPEARRMTILFINDLVAFHLIKLHWRFISGPWLQSPLRYRYEWLTAFYLVYLLVRSRKTLQKK